MKAYRLLIVDPDVAFANHTANFLSGNSCFKVIGIASDGVTALKMFRNNKPDVVLMDPLLQGMDGLSLLRSVQNSKNAPVVICISEAYTSISIEIIRQNGASYYVYKPIELESLLLVLTECCRMAMERQKIEDMREEISRGSELSRKIRNCLHEHGFSFKLSGSEYIARSVELAVESPMVLHNLSTGIYRIIAEDLNISPACIERSMRTAIAHANADGGLTEKIGSTPTNKACIQYLLHELELRI